MIHQIQHPEGKVSSVWDRKVHACDICGRRFVDQDYVKRHNMTYHNPAGNQVYSVKCDQCNATFSSKFSSTQVRCSELVSDVSTRTHLRNVVGEIVTQLSSVFYTLETSGTNSFSHNSRQKQHYVPTWLKGIQTNPPPILVR